MDELTTELAFAELDCVRVWAQTMAVNERSRALLARLGFAHVRTFHPTWEHPLPGFEHGDVEYVLRRERRPGGEG